MAKKDDLIEEAKTRGLELTGSETVAELESMIEAVQQTGAREPEIKRSKVNRGSRRRVERAINRLNEELDAAIKEFDLQAFVSDQDGKRVGEWPLVSELRDIKAHVNDQVNQLLAG